MQAYVAKVEGVKNPKCASMVLNFLLALLASGNKKAFEYISGKLCSVSIRHMRTLIAKKRTTPYISMTKDNICKTIVDHIVKIHAMDDNPAWQVTFSVGIDAKVLVKSFQIFAMMYKTVVGFAAPNHFIQKQI